MMYVIEETFVATTILVVLLLVICLVSVLVRSRKYKALITENHRRSVEVDADLQQARQQYKWDSSINKVKGRCGGVNASLPLPGQQQEDCTAPSFPDLVDSTEEREVVLAPEDDEDEARYESGARPQPGSELEEPAAQQAGDATPEAPPETSGQNSFIEIIPKVELLRQKLKQHITRVEQQQQSSIKAQEALRDQQVKELHSLPENFQPILDMAHMLEEELQEASLCVCESVHGRLEELEQQHQELLEKYRMTEELLSQEQERAQVLEDSAAQFRRMLDEKDEDLTALRNASEEQHKLAEEQTTQLRHDSLQLQEKIRQLGQELRQASDSVHERVRAREEELEQEHRQALEQERAEAEARLSNVQLQVQKLEAQAAQIRPMLDQATAALAEERQASQAKVYQLDMTHRQELESARSEYQRRVDDLEESCREHAQEAEMLRGQLSEAAETHSREVNELSRQKARDEALANEAMQRQAQEHAVVLEGLRRDLDILRAENEQLLTKNSELVGAIQAQQRSAMERTAQLQHHSQQLEERVSQLEKELQQTTDSVRERVRAREEELERQHCELLKQERAKAEERLLRLQARMQELEASVAQQQHKLNQATEALTAERNKSEELSKAHQLGLETQRSQYEQRLEALGQRSKEEARLVEELRANLTNAVKAHNLRESELSEKKSKAEAALKEQESKNKDLQAKYTEAVNEIRASEDSAEIQAGIITEELDAMKASQSKEVLSLLERLLAKHNLKERELLQRLLPKIKVTDTGLGHSEWLVRFEQKLRQWEQEQVVASTLTRCTGVNLSRSSAATQRDESAPDGERRINQLRQANTMLHKEVSHYKRMLYQTEEILESMLQRWQEWEEQHWQERLLRQQNFGNAEVEGEKMEEVEGMTDRERLLEDRCSILEAGLRRLQKVQEVFHRRYRLDRGHRIIRAHDIQRSRNGA